MMSGRARGRAANLLQKRSVIAVAAIGVIAAWVAVVSLRPTAQTDSLAASLLPSLERAPVVSEMSESRTRALPEARLRPPTSKQAEVASPFGGDGHSSARDASDSRAGITSLWDIGGRQKLLGSDIADYLARLVELGELAVPEIEEFLKQGDDLRFLPTGSVRGGGDDQSLRLALFDALYRIGGDTAESVLAEELQFTIDPLEIATLARLLEDLAPKRHRAQAVQAAEEALALAWQGKLKGKDLTPLFQVYRDHHYAREAASALQRNLWKEWGPPAMVALAELDRNAGVPLLIRMARSSVEDIPEVDVFSHQRLLALQMLAQVSPRSFRARKVLFEQASRDRIPDRLWPNLGSALAGKEQLRIDAPLDATGVVETQVVGDHVVYIESESAGLKPEDARTRLGLIDELRAVAFSPDAQSALDSAEVSLERALYAHD